MFNMHALTGKVHVLNEKLNAELLSICAEIMCFMSCTDTYSCGQPAWFSYSQGCTTGWKSMHSMFDPFCIPHCYWFVKCVHVSGSVAG